MHRDGEQDLLDGARAADLACARRAGRSSAETPRTYARSDSGTRRSAWPANLPARMTETTMAQGIEASWRRRPWRASARLGAGADRARPGPWLGRRRRHRRGVGVPPPPAHGVAAARGRDARAASSAATRSPGSSSTSRATVAARRSTSSSRGASPTSVRSRRPPARLRGVRAREPAPRRAARRAGSPGAGSALVATALVAPSWLFLFHGDLRPDVQPVPLLLARLHARRCSSALDHGGRGAGPSGSQRSLLVVAAHPYGVLLLAGQAAFVLVDGARPAPRGDRRRRRRPRPRHPVLAHRPRARRTGSRSAWAAAARSSAGRRRSARYLWRSAGDATRRLVAGHARRRARRGSSASSLAAAHGARARRWPDRRHRSRVRRREARRVGRAGVEAPDLPRAVPRDRGRGVDRPARTALAGARRGSRRGALVAAEVGLGVASHTAAVRVGAGRAPGGPCRGRDMARDDEPARRRALRLRAALPRRLGAEPRVPGDRRPARRRALALRTIEEAPAARPRRLGPRRERAQQRQARARDRASRCPTPAAPYEARVFGPFLVLRTRRARVTPEGVPLLLGAGTARRAVARDRRRRHQPANRRARGARAARLRPVSALALEQLAVARARSRTRRGRPARAVRAAGARGEAPAATADAPTSAAEDERAEPASAGARRAARRHAP